jgi:hypothetical protein
MFQSAHAPDGDTDAVVTLAAVTGQRYRVRRIHWSYDGTPTGGALTIAVDDVVVLTLYAAAAGVFQTDVDIITGMAESVVVTVNAGGGTVKGSVAVEYESTAAAPATTTTTTTTTTTEAP